MFVRARAIFCNSTDEYETSQAPSKDTGWAYKFADLERILILSADYVSESQSILNEIDKACEPGEISMKATTSVNTKKGRGRTSHRASLPLSINKSLQTVLGVKEGQAGIHYMRTIRKLCVICPCNGYVRVISPRRQTKGMQWSRPSEIRPNAI
jgi:hypothetical protein